jgi:hypothetical protein
VARLLFVIHGMGVHSDREWFPAIRTRLDEVAARYPAFQGQGKAFSSQVELVPLQYDREFTEWLDRWNGSADEIERSAVEHSISMPNLVGWLRGVNETEKNFFWSHVVDVLLYRFFSLVTTPVRVSVAQQIVSKINEVKDRNEPVQVSFLCHSLGTAVLHDTLALLASNPSLEARRAFSGNGFPFRAVFMVANVGRVLEHDIPGFQAYRSVVHPLSIRPEDAWFTRFYLFRHKLDPFTLVRRFRPEGWGDRYLAADDLDHFGDFNVHDFGHYLDHPRVHVPLLNDTLPGSVPAAQREAALAAYRPQVEPGCAGKMAEFVTDLRRMCDLIGGQENPADLIRAGTQFLARAKEAADACR